MFRNMLLNIIGHLRAKLSDKCHPSPFKISANANDDEYISTYLCFTQKSILIQM